MKGGGTHLLPGVATTTDDIRPCHLLPTDAEHTVTGKPTSSRVKRSRGSAPPLLLPRCDVGADNTKRSCPPPPGHGRFFMSDCDGNARGLRSTWVTLKDQANARPTLYFPVHCRWFEHRKFSHLAVVFDSVSVNPAARGFSDYQSWMSAL